ncbi:MAG: transglycosylase domain-containing protein [Ktedonobacterales bacterium]
MGRDMRNSYDGERGSNARSIPPGGLPAPSRAGVPNRPSMPGNGSASPSAPGGRRPGSPGGFIRPPLSRDDSGEDSAPARRSGPGSRAGSSPRPAPARNGGSPSRYDDDDRGYRGNSNSSGRSRTPNGTGGRRRSMADIARDASRTMSRQFSSVVARTGRALRHNERDGDYDSRYDSAYDSRHNSTYDSRYDSAYDSRYESAYSDAHDRRPSPPNAARRARLSDEITRKLDSAAYRRSRARMVARKWRMGRVRANPLGYFLVAMLIIFLVVGVVLGGGAGGVYAYSYYASNVDKIQAVADLKNHANSTIYDRNGIPLYTVKGDDQYHIYVPLGQISEYLRDATIDTENRTFYTDSGVDLYATARAALVDAQAGGAAQGASTLTQQLVKLLVLKNSEKAITRKLHEAILAYGVTAQYSKDQILEMYLNEIDYGYPNQGIEAAATNYFGIPQITNPDKTVTTAAQQLQLWQAAMLAGVPNGPTIFKPNVYSCDKAPCKQDQWDNPFAGNPLTSSTPCGLPYVSNFYGTATEDTWYNTHGHEWLVYCRTQLILGHMVDYGDPVKGQIYTSAQKDDALVKVKAALEGQAILKGVSTSINGASSDNRAPHFVQYVVQHLADDFGIDHLESAGLKIYTTLDLQLQDYAQNSLHHYIDENYHEPWYAPYDFPPLKDPSNGNAHNGALVAIDQHNGDILAMVGSVDYNDTSKQVAGNVNITTSRFRSMGSTTKPLVYSTAFEMGWYPGIMLQDIPVCWPNPGAKDPATGKPIVDPAAPACAGGAGGPYYVPHNYEDTNFSGIFPLRRQLDDSLNIAATEAQSFVGMTADSAGAFLNMAQRLGVDSLSSGRMGPTTALGTQEIPLLELSSAYGTFANLGARYPQRAILEIDDNAGNVMWQAPANPYHYQAITPQAAYMVTSVLTDNFARYPFFKLANPLHLDDHPSLEIAGKTGTSNGPNDIVTMGYTPYMTLGVWVGNSDPNDPLTPGIIGIAGAGYIFHDVMDWSVQHYKWDDTAKFPIPSGIARTDFNCLTGLAPFKDSKPANLDCQYMPYPGFAKTSGNPYDPDHGISHRVDEDWYWQNAPPLQS